MGAADTNVKITKNTEKVLVISMCSRENGYTNQSLRTGNVYIAFAVQDGVERTQLIA